MWLDVPNKKLEQTIKLAELFNSWQGEYPFTGDWTTFIRFHACNLECPWCDTMYTPHSIASKPYAIKTILEHINQTRSITFTGGEPSLFLNDIETIWEVLKDTMLPVRRITFETNGTRLGELLRFIDVILEPVKSITHVIWSPKFYNQDVTRKMLQVLYNDYDPTKNIYIKIVADKQVENQIKKFLYELSRLYGDTALQKTAVMPLTDVEFLELQESKISEIRNMQKKASISKEALEYAKRLAREYQVGLSMRLHIIANFD